MLKIRKLTVGEVCCTEKAWGGVVKQSFIEGIRHVTWGATQPSQKKLGIDALANGTTLARARGWCL